jgi:hypothetical protein
MAKTSYTHAGSIGDICSAALPWVLTHGCFEFPQLNRYEYTLLDSLSTYTPSS